MCEQHCIMISMPQSRPSKKVIIPWKWTYKIDLPLCNHEDELYSLIVKGIVHAAANYC